MRHERRMLMVYFFRFVVSVVMMVVISACGPSSQLDLEDSGVMGFGAGIKGDFGSLFRSPDVKPAQSILSGLKTSIGRARQSTAIKAMSNAAKSEFQAAVFREVIKNRGVLSDQLHDALRTILVSNDCDGASCARIFGIKPSQVDGVMDEMLQKAEQSEALKAPESASDRQAVFSSLQRLKPDQKLARIREWFQSLKKSKSSSEGTCLVPAVTAFGTRSNGPFPEYAPSTQNLQGIDYRNPKIDVKSQRSTNTCHTFAMTSLLAHSPQKELAKAKELDVERTVVAIWLAQLGRDVDSALSDEMEFLEKLYRIHQTALQKVPTIKRENAKRILLIESFLAAKLYKQGGNSLDNFQYLQRFGGVSQNPKIPSLDFKKVEDLTVELSLARHNYLFKCLNDKTQVTREGVEEALREPLAKIFDFAKASHINPDPAVAKELRRFEHIRIDVDKSDVSKTVAQITADLKAHGPLYISANGHATTLVGYEKDRQVFWITDSRDKHGRPYIQLAEEDLVRTIKTYSFIKKN